MINLSFDNILIILDHISEVFAIYSCTNVEKHSECH